MKENIMAKRYALGIDYGTESGRALLVDVETGEEVATQVLAYSNGVLDERLPDGTKLDHDWALQDPKDWIAVLQTTIPAVLREAGATPDQIIGIGVDFTSCTVLPVDKQGIPLCNLPQFKNRPHAWVKLWKHHAAQPEADQITQTVHERGDTILERYGGKMSSEWIVPKIWQVLDEDEEIFDAADRFIEGGDWIVEQLCGKETRSSCQAGYKGMWDKEEGFPSPELLKALHPRLENLVGTKLSPHIQPLGSKAGELTESAARLTGLQPGIAVAVGIIDAHAAVPGSGVTEAGKMLMVMGTSTCHMLLSEKKLKIEGVAGCVRDGILPGFYGYEAGQAAVGDIFAWYVENGVPYSVYEEAQKRNTHVHAILEERASLLQPGQSGLIALDWWNGNRSVLVDAELSGLLLGMTLSTKPEEIYLALIEATAFGTRKIIEAFTENGISIAELYACGGLAERNKLMMQVYADVTGLPIRIAASPQTCAMGAAILGAVAAGKAQGGYDTPQEAAARMTHFKDEIYQPVVENHKKYTALFNEYVKLHDYFGRGANDVMKRLRGLRLE